jgi:hypothetical protein
MTPGKKRYLSFAALSLLTAVFLVASSETVARLTWVEDEADPCLLEDPALGDLHRRNCSTREKNAEGEWVQYRFNECGYRSAASCGARPPGTIRIALMGSSASEGLFVRYEDIFATRAGEALSQISGRPVEFQNLGVEADSTDPVNAALRRLPEALSLEPDLIILPVGEYDLNQTEDPARNLPQPAYHPAAGLRNRILNSRARLVAQHYLYEDRWMLFNSYFSHDPAAGLTHVPLSDSWEKRFANLEAVVERMEEQASATGVPLVLTAIPTRLAAAMLSLKGVPPGVDPSAYRREDAGAFGSRLAAIAARNHAGYLDVIDEFRRTPESEEGFYPVDGHLNAQGHAIVTHAFIRHVQDLGVPALTGTPHIHREG